jgi:hypothetical protein
VLLENHGDIKQSVLFSETFTYYGSHMKHINTLCGLSKENFYAEIVVHITNSDFEGKICSKYGPLVGIYELIDGILEF